MVNFTIDQLRELMNDASHVRNMSVIAHVDHGKSTLTDSLIERAGIQSKDGDRYMDTLPIEISKGITIKSTAISLFAELDKDLYQKLRKEKEEEKDKETEKRMHDNLSFKKNEFLVNLIDSPGHVDFSSEVTAALRVTDGALVVVDTIEGVCVQTETVLRQALGERIKPVVIINKVDRALMELQYTQEELYKTFTKVIENVNVVISTYYDKALGDVQCYPDKGTVAFGSGKQGWAFTLRQIAALYAKKFNMPAEKILPRLWGEHYYNEETKKWAKKKLTDQHVRGFCYLALDPIYKLFKLFQDNKKAEIPLLLEKLNIKISSDDLNNDGSKLIKAVMSKFLPAADTVGEMIVIHLPSPVTAQRYRMETLYEGPHDDESAVAIRDCNPKGPLMVYISKMVQHHGRFIAFGRVFSGTVKSGQTVRVQGPSYVPGGKAVSKRIQGTVLMMGKTTPAIQDVPAGNIVGLIGIDNELLKSGTLTTSPSAHNLKVMKFSVSPVVQCSVEVKQGGDLVKLIEGLNRLVKSDPCLIYNVNQAGSHVIACAGELHLEICQKDLEEQYCKMPLKFSQPITSYRESVDGTSSQTALSKSANKHNRLYMIAEPLDEKLSVAIDDKVITALDDFKARARILADDYDWDVTDARKIWCFGPETSGPNVLVDQTKGVQYVHEIKEHVISGFQWASSAGPLAEENMRSIRFNLMDVTLHADTIHRGSGQIIAPTRRVMFASMLFANPCLMEPVFLVDIQIPEQALGGIFSVLTKRRGHIFFQEKIGTSPQWLAKGYLPVAESFGFNADLKAATSGQAFPQLIFDHWQKYPIEKTTETALLLRKKKGIKEEIAPVSDFNDKL